MGENLIQEVLLGAYTHMKAAQNIYTCPRATGVNPETITERGQRRYEQNNVHQQANSK